MGNQLVIATGLDHGADEERWDSVVFILIILIPGHDQQTVVCLCPLDIGIQVFPEPPVTGSNPIRVPAVVHVVGLAWHDHAHSREVTVFGRETRRG